MEGRKGNLSEVLRMCLHHVAPHKARLISMAILTGGIDLTEALAERFGLVYDNAIVISKQIGKIMTIAEEKGYKEIIDVLKEEVDF